MRQALLRFHNNYAGTSNERFCACNSPLQTNVKQNKNKKTETKLLGHVTYLFSVDLDVGDVVFEDRGHIDLGKLILAEDDQKTSLSAGAVSDYH